MAVAATASAAPIPLGNQDDPAYSGFGPAASLNAVADQAPAFLAQAANMLVTAGDTNTSLSNGGVAWTADSMNNSVSGSVVSDFTGTDAGGLPPTSGSYLTKLKADDPTYQSDAQKLLNLGELYTQIQFPDIFEELAGTLYPGGLFSVDHDVAVNSTATVTAPGKPAAYAITLATAGAAASSSSPGYIDPGSEQFTFPKQFSLNLQLLKQEIPYANIWDPTKDGGRPIGSLTISSPASGLISDNLSSTSASGQVYLVHNPNAKSLVPELELWISGSSGASGVEVAVLGKLSGLSFPQTVNFGVPMVGGGLLNSAGLPMQMSLPLSSLTVSFPAASSPFIIPSCSSATAPTAAVSDSLAPYASDFGDDSDGYDASTNTTSPIKAPSSKTVVTDACTKLTTSGASASGIKQGKPKFGFTLSDSKQFSSFSVELPKGFTFAKFSSADLKLTGTTGSGASATAVKVKSVSVKGQKLNVTLSAPTTKVAAKLSGGIAAASSARKDKTVTLKLGAGGVSVAVKFKS
jgi:hypothetical protein